MSDNRPAVCSYEGSQYKTDFWEGQGRQYEDLVERVALRRLMPPTGKRLVEIGAGFGRLTNEFAGYEQVILLDYSRSLLLDAQQRLGKRDRYVYVAANVYQMPLADGVCDGATMIRVIHHMADVSAALSQIQATLAPGATFVLEYANKRNLKAMLRYLLGQQEWSPYSEDPVEFVELNFDFHPRYMRATLQGAQFKTERSLAVSYLRLGVLKKIVPTGLLVGLDRLLQPTGDWGAFSPSVFTRNIAAGSQAANLDVNTIFKCPICKHSPLEEADDHLICTNCGAQWSTVDGIYDFREPLS